MTDKEKLMKEYQLLSKAYQLLVIDENKELKFKLPEEADRIRERMWVIIDKVLEIEQKENKNV